MSKTVSGFVLVGGILLGLACLPASSGTMFGTDIKNEFANQVAQYLGIAGVLLGAGMFFFGAKSFASK